MDVQFGSVEAIAQAASYTDATGIVADYDSVNNYAQVTAKASGAGASIGYRVRAIIAGVLTTLLSFAPGVTAAQFTGTVQTGGDVFINTSPASYFTTTGQTKVHVGGNGSLMGGTAVGAASGLSVLQNAELNAAASAYAYISTDTASRYFQLSGVHNWSTAVSGAAGSAITWVQQMSLSATGLTVNNGLTVAAGGITMQAGSFTGPSTTTFLAGSSNAIQIDSDNTALNTRLFVGVGGGIGLQRVTLGAADSAGAGFRALRVPN